MELLDDYKSKQKELFDYFGYREDWAVIPIEDCRGLYWHLRGEGYGDSVMSAISVQKLTDGSGEHFESDIYTQRHLPRWVYRGKDYTMVCTNPRVDGNRFLSIFDNRLEIRDLDNPVIQDA